MFGALQLTEVARAKPDCFLYAKTERASISRKGNELYRIYGISLLYSMFRVAGFFVSDTPERRVEKYFSVMEVNECIREQHSYIRSRSYSVAALLHTLCCY